MGMLSGIKYIFQIPLDWFRAVDAMVFGDHPGPGIKFDKSGDGSRAISVDYDELDARYGGEEGEYVTLDTAQNISGAKTFENTVSVKAEKAVYFQIENGTASTRGYYGLGDVWLDKASGTSYIYFRNYGRDLLGHISFDRTNGNIKLTSGTNGHAVLDKDPADSTSTTAKDVVTLGYANSKFLRKEGWNANKHLVTDESGKVVEFSGKVGTVGAADALFTGTKKTVTGVSWNGTQIVISSENRTYKNGLLTSVTTNANETINTVTYTP